MLPTGDKKKEYGFYASPGAIRNVLQSLADTCKLPAGTVKLTGKTRPCFPLRMSWVAPAFMQGYGNTVIGTLQ
jgi:hypothetical protein